MSKFCWNLLVSADCQILKMHGQKKQSIHKKELACHIKVLKTTDVTEDALNFHLIGSPASQEEISTEFADWLQYLKKYI